MPWSYPDKVPPPAKNWEVEEQKKCTAAANSVLEEGGSEQDAIFACIRAAGKSKVKSTPTVKGYLESRIHQSFTIAADKLYGIGVLSQEERINISSAIGSALEKFSKLFDKIDGLADRIISQETMEQMVEQGWMDKMKEISAEEILELAEQNPELTDFQLVEKASEVVEEEVAEEGVEDIIEEAIIEEKIIKQEPLFSRFFSIKGKNDKDYWVALSGSAFKDRANEIVSRRAIDYGVEHGDKTGQRGELRVYHYPNSRIGSCTFQMRQGNFLIEAGTWDDTVRAQKVKEWINSKDPDEIGISVGFFYDPKKFKNGVYEDSVIFFERSILKKKHASCPWATVRTIQGGLKAMSHKNDLTEIIGEEEAEAVLEGAEEASKALEEQGVAFKETEDKAKDKVETAEKAVSLEGVSEDELKALYAKVGAMLRKSEPKEKSEEKKKEVETEDEDAVQTFQLDEAAIKAIADAVRETLPDSSELEAKVKALEDSAVKSAEVLTEQVETKVKEVFEELPKATIYRATKVKEEEPEVVSQWVNPLDLNFEDGIREIERAREAGR